MLENISTLAERFGLRYRGECNADYQCERQEGSHRCVQDDVVRLPPFIVYDVVIRCDQPYDPTYGNWLHALRHFQSYRLEGALMLHEHAFLLGEDEYRDATVVEFACGMLLLPWTGSLRGRVFSSAELTLQTWYKNGQIIATQGGSGEGHHRMKVPRDIPPYWS